eukprot:10995415-Alexandrium_andersonii.AAC.1
MAPSASREAGLKDPKNAGGHRTWVKKGHSDTCSLTLAEPPRYSSVLARRMRARCSAVMFGQGCMSNDERARAHPASVICLKLPTADSNNFRPIQISAVLLEAAFGSFGHFGLRQKTPETADNSFKGLATPCKHLKLLSSVLGSFRLIRTVG